MFVGRNYEIDELTNLRKKNIASFVVLQGRRRIGKSRLAKEFAKGKKFYNFVGLAPSDSITSQTQRDEFCRQLSEQTGLPQIKMDDWGDVFTLLFKQLDGNEVVVFDEISWMGYGDKTFLTKLKTAWDNQFSVVNKLILIVCGSVSSWIEKNIISNTAFLGRPSLYMNLKELQLSDCNKFWGKFENRISAYEKLKILSVTGGVQRYLELIDPSVGAEENLKRLCFEKNSPLVDEFERVFSDIFGVRSEVYKKIIFLLSERMATLEEIMAYCERTKTGDFSEYLRDLVLAGFVSREYRWSIKTGKISKLSIVNLDKVYAF